ncbi:MAG: hypothetical protein IJI01_08275 [Butyrivibrio sp.]|uniref:hypothetical protein n=1 Tax=Butyrivibrio sp. TaxID=28121 RepID=UPI0025C12622|nr:hypothetical protein [Butyrivibrio sp.]MBQ6588659.1 hypothetical protein [Butyrivibrio sp.]MBQ7148835.1 hypothetical protein [Pseudobutyrivibrio sp.]
MKIAQSEVNLVSSNHYYEENTVSISSGVVAKGTFQDNLQKQENAAEKGQNVAAAKDPGKKTDSKNSNQLKLSDYLDLTSNGNSNKAEDALGSETYNNLKSHKSAALSTYEMSLQEQIAQIRASLLESLLSFLQLIGGDNSRSGYKETIEEASSLVIESHFVKVTTIQMSHVEEESTSFSGKGMAMTEDGRTIDFNVNFSMSRRLTRYAGISLARAVNMIDPLVINVGSDVTSISDQNFFFDLDCDGEKEKIKGLGPGTGFLTYDRNGDGVINDGSELFGTKSGDGFRDLAQYDDDGNGWIDENDAIYGKLQVWLRGEDGVDTLLSLQEADVGAIFLGSAETDYTFMDNPGSGERVNGNGTASSAIDNAGVNMTAGMAAAAMMRASGLFLRESGGVGTVHQVDLARL